MRRRNGEAENRGKGETGKRGKGEREPRRAGLRGGQVRKWESGEVTGNQVIRLSSYQAKGETENPDIPISRYTDTEIHRSPITDYREKLE